jgi:uncharacterized CHY-type Zn-finger protein
VANLSWYLQECTDLLRDANNQFTTVAQLTRYINTARREVAKRTACLQALVTGQAPFGTGAQAGNMIVGGIIPNMLPNSAANNANEPGAVATPSNSFTTLPGTEVYTYSYANPYLQQQYTGYKSVIYVFNVSVSWGGSRPTLTWTTWDNLQAYCRSYNQGVNSYPQVWSQKGVGENGQVWLFPVPINTPFSEMEWECVCTPTSLYTNDDYDVIPESYQGCIKYYACYLAYMGQQRTGMAEIMRGLFDEQILINGVATDWGHVENYYSEMTGGF